jgi:hypothetical protein
MEYFMQLDRSGERVVVGDPTFAGEMKKLLTQGDDLYAQRKEAHP